MESRDILERAYDILLIFTIAMVLQNLTGDINLVQMYAPEISSMP